MRLYSNTLPKNLINTAKLSLVLLVFTRIFGNTSDICLVQDFQFLIITLSLFKYQLCQNYFNNKKHVYIYIQFIQKHFKSNFIFPTPRSRTEPTISQSLIRELSVCMMIQASKLKCRGSLYGFCKIMFMSYAIVIQWQDLGHLIRRSWFRFSLRST